MNFVSYNDIENCYRQLYINKIVEQGFNTVRWCVTEKVHGSNFSFWFDGSSVRCAKRSGFIDSGETFYGYEKVLERLSPKVKQMFDYLQESREGVSHITIYGELFGGTYKHPDVPRDAEATIVQKGIFYSPHNDFYGFDIKVNGKFLPVHEANELFEKFGFFYAKILLEGTLEECLKYPNHFQTKIPEWLGYPTIEDNIAEGVVIKPLIPIFENNGSRIIMKNKDEKFSEKTGKKPATVRTQIPMGEEAQKYLDELSGYINENRLRAVISKIGKIDQKEFGKLNGLFVQDALKDFEKDFPDFLNLEDDQMKRVKKEIQNVGSAFIRPIFCNVIDGTF